MSPGMNIFPLDSENSRIISPAHENSNPAIMKRCKWFVSGLRFNKNNIMSTGMIRALTMNPGQKAG
jgi:hypothetical protein